ncbi:MAG: hypothetical protein PHW52_01035 [Candidatus Pacebacteria bacterium]|nr:hypothetical protein [Candidatus Paceibacterota bacterium]
MFFIIISCSTALADDPGNGYYLKNTTKNLLSLNERIIDNFAPMVFSEEEQQELRTILKKEDLLTVQDQLLDQNNLLKNDYLGGLSNEPGDESVYKSYATCAYYQKIVLLDDYFAGMDFVVRQLGKFL